MSFSEIARERVRETETETETERLEVMERMEEIQGNIREMLK